MRVNQPERTKANTVHDKFIKSRGAPVSVRWIKHAKHPRIISHNNKKHACFANYLLNYQWHSTSMCGQDDGGCEGCERYCTHSRVDHRHYSQTLLHRVVPPAHSWTVSMCILQILNSIQCNWQRLAGLLTLSHTKNTHTTHLFARS